MSHRILAVVEGQTEFSVLRSTLAPHLGALGISFSPKVVGRPGHKGGAHGSFESVIKEIVNHFKQEPTAVVTTFFDFYALPGAWPGVAKAKEAKASGLMIGHVARMIEEEWQAQVKLHTAHLGCEARFMPYVQMHELESLLFASPKDMAEIFGEPELEAALAGIVRECGGCEEINDHPHSAPSKRIEALFPGYRKGRDRNRREDRRPHAPLIVERAGLAVVRNACPHFDGWVTRLEALAADAADG